MAPYLHQFPADAETALSIGVSWAEFCKKYQHKKSTIFNILLALFWCKYDVGFNAHLS